MHMFGVCFDYDYYDDSDGILRIQIVTVEEYDRRVDRAETSSVTVN